MKNLMNLKHFLRNWIASKKPARKKVLLILGMHRSGTSALAEALHTLGFGLPDQLMPATTDNARGYFEPQEMVKINNELLGLFGLSWHDSLTINSEAFQADSVQPLKERAKTFLQATTETNNFLILKDPRLCRTLPFWLEILRDLNCWVGSVIVVRAPDEVAHSLMTRVLNDSTRPAGLPSLAKAKRLWLRYVTDGELFSRQLPRAWLNYDDLIENGTEQLQRIQQTLQIDFPVMPDQFRDLLAPVISPEFRHQHKKKCTTAGSSSSVYRLYDMIRENELSMEQQTRYDEFNQVRQRLSESDFLDVCSDAHEFSPRQGELLLDLHRKLTKDSFEKGILFVSSASDSVGHIYRVHNHVEALKCVGIHAQWCELTEWQEMRLEKFCAILVFRPIWSDTLASLFSLSREKGLIVLTDFDDLLFEKEYMREPHFDYWRQLPLHERGLWEKKIDGWLLALQNADAVVVSTKPLMAAVNARGKHVFLWRNGFDWLGWTNFAKTTNLLNQDNSEQRIRLGYASGTATHQRDFAQVAPALAGILHEFPRCLLTVVGFLDLSEFPYLSGFLGQIELRPHVPYQNLPDEYIRFDINLAPLDWHSPFCAGKSELKFFEAAALSIPTIASPTPPYLEIICQGTNGYLATDTNDWYNALKTLINDSQQRRKIGREAYYYALTNFGPEQQSAEGELLVETIKSIGPIGRFSQAQTPNLLDIDARQ